MRPADDSVRLRRNDLPEHYAEVRTCSGSAFVIHFVCLVFVMSRMSENWAE